MNPENTRSPNPQQTGPIESAPVYNPVLEDSAQPPSQAPTYQQTTTSPTQIIPPSLVRKRSVWKNPLILSIVSVLIVAYVGASIFTVVHTQQSRTLKFQGVSGQAKIVSKSSYANDGSNHDITTTYAAVYTVLNQPTLGKMTFTSDVPESYWQNLEPGQIVPVIYNPKNSQQNELSAALTSESTNWIVPIAVIFIPPLFIIYILVQARLSKRKIARYDAQKPMSNPAQQA